MQYLLGIFFMCIIILAQNLDELDNQQALRSKRLELLSFLQDVLAKTIENPDELLKKKLTVLQQLEQYFKMEDSVLDTFKNQLNICKTSVSEDIDFLFEAVEENNIKLLKRLISRGVDLNAAKNKTEDQPLILALRKRDSIPFIIELVRNGASLLHWKLPYHWCLSQNNQNDPNIFELIEALYDFGIDLNQRDENGLSPLHLSQNAKITRFFCERGLSTKVTDSKGFSPLSFAWNEILSQTLLNLSEDGDYVFPQKFINLLDVVHTLLEFEESLETVAIDVNMKHSKFSLIEIGENQLGLKLASKKVPIIFLLQFMYAGIQKISSFGSNSDIPKPSLQEFIKIAVAKYHEIIAYLLDRDVNVNSSYRNTPLLIYSIHCGIPLNLLEKLLQKGANINSKSENGLTAIFVAMEMGDDKLFNLLYDFKAELNFRYTNGETILHRAVANGRSTTLIRDLISKGADTNLQDRYGNSPLYLSLINGNIDVAEVLISESNVNLVDEFKKSLLHHAIALGRLRIVQSLINRRIDMNIQDHEGKSALHYAILFKHAETAKFLIDSGALPGPLDEEGKSPLHYAITSGCMNISTHLIDKGADKNCRDHNGKSPLTYAITFGCIEVAKYLINNGADLNLQDNEGRSAIHTAVTSGYLQVSKILYQKKENPNVATNSELSNKYLEIAEQLIDKGAELNLHDNDGKNPLHVLLSFGYTDAVKTSLIALNVSEKLLVPFKDLSQRLIDKGIELNQRDSTGKSPLHYALLSGHLDIAKVLIEKGAEVNLLDEHGHSPLHQAVIQGYIDVAESLISKNASLNLRYQSGRSVLHFAIFAGNVTLVNLLVDKGAELNFEDNWRRTPLHYATLFGFFDIIENLVKNGADINKQDENGRTALHYACYRIQLEIMQYLVNNGAEFNLQDETGKSPLHYAVFRNHSDAVKYLVKKGAYSNLKDNAGKSSLYYAVSLGLSSIENILLTRGALTNLQDLSGRYPSVRYIEFPVILSIISKCFVTSIIFSLILSVIAEELNSPTNNLKSLMKRIRFIWAISFALLWSISLIALTREYLDRGTTVSIFSESWRLTQ